MFPLLDFAVQEAKADARGARQSQCGQDGVDPDVIDDDLVVHKPAVHVDCSTMSAIALDAAGHSGHHGSRRGRGDRARGGRRGCWCQ